MQLEHIAAVHLARWTSRAIGRNPVRAFGLLPGQSIESGQLRQCAIQGLPALTPEGAFRVLLKGNAGKEDQPPAQEGRLRLPQAAQASGHRRRWRTQ